MSKLTYIDVIDETVKFYSEDTSRRSVANNGKCLYIGPDGRRCAFSRCCTDDAKFIEDSSASMLLRRFGQKILKEEYRHLDNNKEFWDLLQSFHDHSGNWSEKGLTAKGKGRVKYLKNKFKE